MEQTEERSHETILDVREIDGEPFGDIMNELEDLSDTGSLLLINSFEPEPLYQVFEQRGFDYSTTQVDDAEWHIEVTDSSNATEN